MKKKYLIASMVILFAACTNKDDIKKELKEEIKKELSAPKFKKGDGTYFYNEPMSTASMLFYINHSTLQCPAIKNGVQRDYRLTAKEARGRNLFCSKCMDDKLIDTFESQWNQYCN